MNKIFVLFCYFSFLNYWNSLVTMESRETAEQWDRKNSNIFLFHIQKTLLKKRNIWVDFKCRPYEHSLKSEAYIHILVNCDHKRQNRCTIHTIIMKFAKYYWRIPRMTPWTEWKHVILTVFSFLLFSRFLRSHGGQTSSIKFKNKK